MRSGLTSVTFRKKSAEEIVRLAREARLDGIEWGGDVHVPPNDLKNAGRVGDLTRKAGLSVLSYGSYYRLGEGDFSPVSEAAEALGCKTIRIWMPWNEPDYEKLYSEAQKAADGAEKRGQTLCFEFHGGTAADGVESTLKLLRFFGRENLRTYWQPPYWDKNWSAKRAGELPALAPFVRNLHVYHWTGEENDRRPLSEGAADWKAYFSALCGAECALLEFVRKDDEAQFMKDAKTLRELLGQE